MATAVPLINKFETMSIDFKMHFFTALFDLLSISWLFCTDSTPRKELILNNLANATKEDTMIDAVSFDMNNGLSYSIWEALAITKISWDMCNKRSDE